MEPPDPLLDVAIRWLEAHRQGWELAAPPAVGGTSSVFKIARGNEVAALKVYSDKGLENEDIGAIKTRIDRQLEIGAHNCPYLIQVFDGGVFEGRPYILMEYVPGEELKTVLDSFPRADISTVLDHIARAIIYLHSRGFTHRDIKPANIIWDQASKKATLLDTSVLKPHNDEVSETTDVGGVLPVIATAQYSPPEYLFRLESPSPDLWKSLDIYQLSAIAHDLIMRKPLFQAEFEQCKANKYRFAWVIATQRPRIIADDVDQLLVFLANMGLSKKWRDRLSISPDDFLATNTTPVSLIESYLGSTQPVGESRSTSATGRMSLHELCKSVESLLVERLSNLQIRATHKLEGLGANEPRTLLLNWEIAEIDGSHTKAVSFQVDFRLLDVDGTDSLSSTSDLTIIEGSKRLNANLTLPSTPTSNVVASDVVEEIYQGLLILTRRLKKEEEGVF